ncbi:MAG: hypothetical protein V1850_01960 [Candidatus Bathyarchaeota archaeon]
MVETVLRAAEKPLSIDAVRFQTKLKSWSTARAILLEMLADRTINGLKTSRGWIFWIEQEAKP